MYTCYLLTDKSRAKILQEFQPKFEKVFAHHVTVQFGVDETHPLPDKNAKLKIVGYSSNDVIECLVIAVDDNLYRPDGSIYHCTLSLDPSKAKPVDSNRLLKERDWQPLDASIALDHVSTILK